MAKPKKDLPEFASSCGIEQILDAGTMEDAVNLAHSLSEVGDVILLSPASASWDQYASFEVRGDAFIDAVMSL